MDQPTTLSTADASLDEFLGAPPPSKAKRYLKWGAIGLLMLILLWIASRFFGGSGDEVHYATAKVECDDLTVSVSATGNLQPTNQVDVGVELSGTVTQVLVDNNDRVTRGQLLARLDTSRLQDTIRQSRAALASAVASVSEAQATAQQARANLSRLEQVYRLSGGKVPSATELDTARAENARAQAGIRTAQAGVAQARAQLSSDITQLSKASIHSPVTGVVLSRQVEPGQTVAASLNAPVLFTIAEDLSEMQLEVKVDEADVGQVQQGQRATFTVDAFPGRSFPAIIERVDVGANASGSTTSSSGSSSTATNTVVAYTAVLTVQNSEQILRPGMTATADIVTAEKKNVVMVPNAALRFSPDRAGARAGQGGGVTSVLMPPRRNRGSRGAAEVSIGRGSRQQVYVLGEDSKPKPIQVVVGESNGSQTEVVGNQLKPGMEVIVGQRAADEESGGDAR
jgi:HlyD family secretion protein